MEKFRVKSGEFEIIVNEDSALKAGVLAIKLHYLSNNSNLLGELTLIALLNDDSDQVGDHSYFCTDSLIGKTNGSYVKEIH